MMGREILAPDFIEADYVVICKGDSMINARIFDGDIVFVRSGVEVENGQIAVVLADDEIHLGRIWNQSDGFVLQPENPLHESRVFYNEGNAATIIGRAVAFTSMLPDKEVNV